MAAVFARDLKLTGTGDLDMTGGDLNFVDDTLAIIQLVSSRLQIWQGEWFADQRQGMPYPTQVFIRNPGSSLGVLRQIYMNAIAGTPGILRVISCEVSFDNARRALTVSWQAQAQTSGTIIQNDNLIYTTTTKVDPSVGARV
jgi:hypothetical protein